MSPRIVAFVVTNPYLDAGPFARVADALRRRGAECRMFVLHRAIPATGFPFPVRRIPLLGGAPPRRGAVGRVLQFAAFVADKYLLARFVRRERPHVAVIGGDMTDHYGRLFLDTCRAAHVPVVLVPVAMPGPALMNADPDKGVPAARAVRAVLRLFGLEKAVFFRNWVLGSYHREALIAAPCAADAELLGSHGIDRARLRITGHPGWDALADLARRPADEVRRAALEPLGIPAGSKTTVVLSEVIDAVYGLEFLETTLARIAEAFQDLPATYRVVVKLHPRESARSAELFRKTLSGPRYVIAADAALLPLLRAADLAIGFYSKALVDAALLGTPVLSLRFHDDAAPVRFGAVGDATHVTRVEDLAGRIQATLDDPAFLARQRAAIAAWRERDGYVLDGRCGERVADAILAVEAA